MSYICVLFTLRQVQTSVFFHSTVHVLLNMQLSDYHNPASLHFPSLDYSDQAIDFSAPASLHHRQDGDDVLDLRIRPRNEPIVKEERYAVSCACMTAGHDHPSPSAVHPYVSCPHAPSRSDAVSAYAQPPNAVLQPSQPNSPSLFSRAFVVPSSSVISVTSTAAPSASRESLQIPFCPQYTLYHHTPSTEGLSNLQLASSSENSLSNTASIQRLSPSPSVGIQLPTFQFSPAENNFQHFARPSSVVENQTKKHARPFKAISLNFKHTSAVNDEHYRVYRQQMLEHIKAEKRSSENKKSHSVTKRSSSPQSSSSSSEGNPANGKDAAYLEKRRKNNAAAKRSRDARRAKEDELAIRTAYLERENTVLKCLLAQCTHCSFQVVNSTCVSNM
jgi:Basic region leucine zipper.